MSGTGATIDYTPFHGGKVPAVILDRCPDFGNAEGCWRWTGPLRNGYAVVRVRVPGMTNTQPVQVHRYVWEVVRGRIPATSHGEPVQLDHLCRVPACIRPDHLEPVSRSENLRRRDEARRAVKARMARKPRMKGVK